MPVINAQFSVDMHRQFNCFVSRCFYRYETILYLISSGPIVFPANLAIYFGKHTEANAKNSCREMGAQLCVENDPHC